MTGLNRKTFTALTLILLLGAGKASHAQNTRPPKKQIVKEKLAQNPDSACVSFSPVNESIYMEAIGFTYATPENFKLVWAPLLVVQPTVTVNNKYTIGFTTTQMFQNYTNDKLVPTIHDIYAHAKANVGPVNAFVILGNFSALNYAGQMSKHMPMSYFFQNAIYMQSGHYLPMAIMGGIRNDKFSLSAGYAKKEHRLQFNGPGDVIITGEAFFKKFKIGTLWMLGHNQKVGDVQFVYDAGMRSALLIEFIGIGTDNIGGHMTYSYKIANDQAQLLVNAYGQKNGIAGWHLGGRHINSGIYFDMGFTYHDPLLQGTEKYETPTPILELGIRKPLLLHQEKTK